MDMSSNFRPEFHIAQQSRRDKLRIQSDSGVYVSNLDQINAQDNLPYQYCSEMANFPVNSQGILAERVNLMVHQESDDKRVCSDAASLGNFCRTIPYTFSTPPATGNGDPQYFSTWKSIGSQSTSDWVPHQTPIFVGDGLSASSFKLICNNSTTAPMESHCPNDLSGAISIPNSYQNPLQELVVTSSNVQPFGLELGQRSCADESSNGGWVLDQFRCKSQPDLISRAAEVCPQWGGHVLNYAAGGNGDGDLRKGRSDKSNTQALSLSLSSVPSPKVQTTQVTEKYSTTDSLDNVEDSRNLKPENLSGNLSKVLGTNGRQDLGTLARRHPGPLGPFTGYATILRGSKFLRPARQLLDELCCFSRSKNVDTYPYSDADKALEEVRVSGEVVCNTEALVRAADDQGGSSFVINDSNGKSRELGAMICPRDSFQPENLQRKAKLLCMQDEVCKRYKQYHQQMQMVVSSFESVAGLSSATPYVSFALKMVSKHFRCLKNAITEQLKSIRNALGDDESSLGAGTSGSKGDAGVSMLKFFDQSIQKQKQAGSVGGIVDGQHIWRPQRGLPERAVSILRAWLFDHFLHPYPTDSDKHMLASQTGLTRNQVSNWFINARVRLWKPMVEEIHMLETKGMAEPGSDAPKPTIGGCSQTNNTAQSFNMLGTSNMIPEKQVEFSITRPSEYQADGSSGMSPWNHDKRSRIEYHAPSSVGGSLVGLVPGIEIGGLGAVSLTLGLRQSVENAQRPAALQQEHNLRSRFGGQIIRDFVG